MFSTITFVIALTLLASAVDCKSVDSTTISSSNSTTTTAQHDGAHVEVLHVPLNGSVAFDCDRLEAFVLDSNKNASNVDTFNTTAPTTITTSVSPTGYSLVMFKKDGLVVQVANPKLRVEALGIQNEGSYECGHHQMDKFGKLNYSFRKSWTVKIDFPKVEVTTTTGAPVSGEVFVTQESLTDFVDLDKKNINIFTYSNPAIIFVLVAGFLVICATFLVIILLFNVRTCRSCQRPRGKELL